MRTSTDVLIVGAGPVGLMLAGALQRRGIDHVLIDQRPQPEYYCKALGVTPRTLEVWDQIGVLEDALRFGIFTAGMSGAVNGVEIATENVTLGSMPYGFLMLAQYDTERILRRSLQQHGGRVQQGVALTGFEIGSEGYGRASARRPALSRRSTRATSSAATARAAPCAKAWDSSTRAIPTR